MKKISISMLGLGTIGSQLAKYLQSNLEELSNLFHIKLEIDKAFVRDLTKTRDPELSNLCLTNNPYDVIKNADIVIECLGGNGVELTRELVLKTLKLGKAVIMSSKKCLALYGPEIMSTVKQYHGILHYDATVGGGIPISSIFETMGRCEETERIYGICNGTSNYILDKMDQEGISYQLALNKAIRNGYSENNPSEDVEGYDSLYKAIIMMGFGMNCWIDSKTISPKAITNLTQDDFFAAKKFHSVIKPVFILEKTTNSVTCFIGPKLVPKNTLLATVKENNNIIVVCGSESHERAFYGQGAGSKPTASAMFDDINKTITELLCNKLSINSAS